MEYMEDIILEIYLGKFVHPNLPRTGPYREFLNFERKELFFPGPPIKETWCSNCGKRQFDTIGVIKITFDVEANVQGEILRIRDLIYGEPCKTTQECLTEQLKGNKIYDKIYRHCLISNPVWKVSPKGRKCCECIDFDNYLNKEK